MVSPHFVQRLDEAARLSGAMLQTLLTDARLEQEIARPARLLAAMRHGALNGGKRLRPFLTLEATRLLGGSQGSALRAGCAIELVHCYSLVHDDLPAMDDDDLRRGQPTVHKAFDEATAILAGDGLLTLAFDAMASAETHANAQTRCALVVGLARAAGLGGMAGGQMLDLEAETATQPLDREAIARMQSMKTGALLRFSVEAGAICADASDDDRAALVQYGEALGAAFQIADDILDAEGEADKLGKAAGKDAARNKATLVAALGIDGARALCSQRADDALAAISRYDARADTLRDCVRFVIARDH
jgi:farnesyl diphosphate synthase